MKSSRGTMEGKFSKDGANAKTNINPADHNRLEWFRPCIERMVTINTSGQKATPDNYEHTAASGSSYDES